MSETDHGGKRKNSGRKRLGKKRFNVTLTEDNVEEAKGKTSNLSGLLDELLADWLKKNLK